MRSTKANDPPITAADVKRYHDALALHAERRGRRGNVLNVFALLDGEALPDFTRGTGGI